jgi:hypothetical protein
MAESIRRHGSQSTAASRTSYPCRQFRQASTRLPFPLKSVILILLQSRKHASLRLTYLGVSCAAGPACRSRSGAAVAAEEFDEQLANWSGRPGRLLAPAPLQIRTCGITASGSSSHGFTALRSPDPRFVDAPLTPNDSSTMSRCVSFRRFRDPALRFPPLAPAGYSSPASAPGVT